MGFYLGASNRAGKARPFPWSLFSTSSASEDGCRSVHRNRLGIDELSAWEENRQAAQPLRTLMHQTLNGIARSPKIPPVFMTVEGVEVRRVLVRPSPYHLYNRVDEAAKQVLVLAIWSGARGELPEL